MGTSAISAGKYEFDFDVAAVQELLKASGKPIVVEDALQDLVTETIGTRSACQISFRTIIATAIESGFRNLFSLEYLEMKNN